MHVSFSLRLCLPLACAVVTGMLGACAAVTREATDPSAEFMCLAPGSSPTAEQLATVHQLWLGSRPKYYSTTRWASTSMGPTGAPGEPISIRWSYVPDTVTIPGYDDAPGESSSLFSGMDTKFAGNRALWTGLVRECFDRIGDLTGVAFIYATDGVNPWDDAGDWFSGQGNPTRGDIRIGMRSIDNPLNIVAGTSAPGPGGSAGNIRLDASEDWGNPANNYQFLRHVIMHELCHALGLAHSCPMSQSKLMEPVYSPLVGDLTQDDLRALHSFYGDAVEPNNSAVAATNLGALNHNASLTYGAVPEPAIPNGSLAALSNSSDTDWYVISLAPGLHLLSVQATPLGSAYPMGPQVNGVCNADHNEQALLAANLGLQVLGSNGVTNLRTATANPAGESETITNLLITGGTATRQVYIRVFPEGTVVSTQEYTINVSSGPVLSLTASLGVYVDRIVLGWTMIPSVAYYDVYRSNSPGRTSAVLIGSTTVSSFEDTSATGTQPYYYWVAAQQNDAAEAFEIGPERGYLRSTSACPADIGTQGGVPGTDGLLDNNDFIVFIDYFFNMDPRADFGRQGGIPPADGLFDNNDFVVFINAFFGGCP